jgi:Spy/CpxP family protein refolding chaperone
MKKIMIAVTMVVLLAAAGLAMAQGCEKCSGMGMGYGPHSGAGHSGGHGLWKALNLTPEQMQKVQALRESFFKETLPLRNDLMSKKLEMRSLWLQTNPDEEKILAKQKEISALRAQLGERAIKNRFEMRSILTPEQQAKLANLRGGEWGEHGRGCGSGLGPGHHHHEMGMDMGYGPRW